jgi:hypothetical protein
MVVIQEVYVPLQLILFQKSLCRDCIEITGHWNITDLRTGLHYV